MVNTNNTKFTFNKKGFALSLACVGLLATAGNAAVTADGGVSLVTTDSTKIAAVTSAGNIYLTGTNNLNFYDTSAAITAGGAITIREALDKAGSLGIFNVYNTGADKSLQLEGLTINTNSKVINLGKSGASLTLSGAGLTLGADTSHGTINISEAEWTNIINAGTIKLMQNAHPDKASGGAIDNNGRIDVFKNATNWDNGHIAVGNMGTFINDKNATISGGTFDMEAADSLELFSNAGTINAGNVVINNGNVGSFENAKTGVISGGTLSVSINNSFTNAGTINNANFDVKLGSDDVQAKSFTNASKAFISGGMIHAYNLDTLTNAGTLSGNNIKIHTLNTFDNQAGGVISGGTINLGTTKDFTNAGTILGEQDKITGVITNSFTNSGRIDVAVGAGQQAFQLGTEDVRAKSFTNTDKGNISGAAFLLANLDSFSNAGVISGGLIVNGNTGTFTNSGKIFGVNTSGNIANFDNQTGGTISGGTLAPTITTSFTNAGVIKGDSNYKITLGEGLEARDAVLTANNSGNISASNFIVNGVIKSFTNTSAGTITGRTSIYGADATEGNIIQNFENAGLLKNVAINSDGTNVLTFGTFTNSGTIKNNDTAADAKIKVDIIAGSFDNTNIINVAGASGAGGQIDFSITAHNSFNNAGSITQAASHEGQLSIKIGNAQDIASKAAATFTNSGVIDAKSGASITVNGIIKSFENTSAGTTVGTISGLDIAGDAANKGVIQNFNNAGIIKNGVTSGKSLKGVDLTINNFTNSGLIQTSTDAEGIKVDTSFTNTATGSINLSGAGSVGAITLAGAENATSAKLVANNAGNIDKANVITSGIVKSFTNTGTISNATFSVKDATDTSIDVIQTFNNANLMDKVVAINLRANDFTNTGTINFTKDTTTNIELGVATAPTTEVSFNNAGTISNLQGAISIADGKRNATFTNTGVITAQTNKDVGLLSIGDSVTAEFNNAGTITLAGSGVAIAGGANIGTGNSVNITNTGVIELGRTTGADGSAHIDIANIDKTNVREWHISGLSTADAFNANATAGITTRAIGTDKIVVRGYDGNVDRNLTFANGSIVLDPVKNPNIQVGTPFLLDHIVVDAEGAPLQAVYNVAANGEVTAGDYYSEVAAVYDANGALKAGAVDPRLVTINTVRSSDPIFEIVGVDAFDAEGNRVGVAYEGSTETKNADGTTTTTPTTMTRKGDGIVDSFQVGVNASKGAGAAVVQNAVNNSITRNAFIGNVVNTAVNSTLATLNNLNRVSYNDAEVDFDKLEKYAAVSSDVTDQTYAKDSNVYVMPYYRSTSVDLAEGSLDADTYGIVLGGNKNLGDAGVIGLFLGYENADGSANTVDTEDDTFFGGINYYKTLGGTSSYDYFVKGMLRLANTSSDVTRKSGNYGTSSADTFSYGVEANVGMNFYNGIHTITPEVGLSYDRVEVDGFMLDRINYDDNNINLVMGKIGLNWLAQFTESVSTNVGFGIRYNFNDDFDAGLRILNGGVYSTNTDLGDFYYYVNLGVNYAITQNWELGVMYTGDFSSDASSHSGFVKLGYWW